MKVIGEYTYSVDENNAVRVWETTALDAGEPPFLFQPTHPDNTPFADNDDAITWIENYLNTLIEAQNNTAIKE